MGGFSFLLRTPLFVYFFLSEHISSLDGGQMLLLSLTKGCSEGKDHTGETGQILGIEAG